MKAKALIVAETSLPCGEMVGSGMLGQQGRGLCWPDSEFLVSFRARACDGGLCSQRRGPWPPCCSPSGWSAASSTTTACWCRVSPGGSWQGLVLMEDAIQPRDLGVQKSSWGQRELLSHPPPRNCPLGCPSHLQHVLLCPGGQLSHEQGADLPWSCSACQKGPNHPHRDRWGKYRARFAAKKQGNYKNPCNSPKSFKDAREWALSKEWPPCPSLSLTSTHPAPKWPAAHAVTAAPLSSVQSLSRLQLFTSPWTAAHQASLSITNSGTLLKLMSIESVMPSNHLVLCCPLLHLPSIFPSMRVFSSESVLAFGGQSTGISASVLPMGIQD